MKNILLIFVILMNVKSFAGTPNQDPVIVKIRTEFSTGKIPKISDLRLDTPIDCYEFSAMSDNFTVTSNKSAYLFRAVNGVFLNDGIAHPRTLALDQQKGLYGSYSDSNYQYAMVMRLSQSGTLIGEWMSRPGFDSKKTVSAISDINFVALTYLVCP